MKKEEIPFTEQTHVTLSNSNIQKGEQMNNTRRLLFSTKEKEKGKEKKKKDRISSKNKKDSSSKSKGESAGKDLATTDPLPCTLRIMDDQKLSVDGNHTSYQVLNGKIILSGIAKLQENFQTFLSPLFMYLKASFKDFIGLIDIRSLSYAVFYQLESLFAVIFSVTLLLALHGASWFIHIHRIAFRAVLNNRHIGFCFVFMYAFPFLVQYVIPWAPPWAPVCLWYAFLVQLFCTNGPTAMVTTFRIILPLFFLIEGVSHHSFLLDLNGKFIRSPTLH
jgi:hypothetical protein